MGRGRPRGEKDIIQNNLGFNLDAVTAKNIELVAAMSDRAESVGQLRALMDSFKVEVVLQDSSANDQNAIISCFMALNLLPRFLKCVRYRGTTGLLSLFPPSHSAKINLGRDGEWKPAVTLVFGREKYDGASPIYVTSAGWSVYISREEPCKWPVPTDQDKTGAINKISAMYAGALAVGEIFKQLVSPYVKAEIVAKTFEYDLVTHGKAPQPVIRPALPDMIHFDSLAIIGNGAVGQAFVVALANACSISGHVILIDHDRLEPSNEQRYLLGYEEHRGKPKVNLMQEMLRQGNPALSITMAPMSYEDTISAFEGLSFQPRTVVAAVDNARTRVNIQAMLPETAWNVWTDVSEGSLRYGVGRHDLKNQYECMACSYFPKAESSPTQLDMNSAKTGIPKDELARRLGAGDMCRPEDIDRIAVTNNVAKEGLQVFVGMPLKEVLHGNCGLFNISLPQKQETAPAPHAPALAGMFLASQLVLSRLEPPPEAKLVESVAEFDCLGLPDLNCLMKKHRNPSCFCGDQDYQNAYGYKWEKARKD